MFTIDGEIVKSNQLFLRKAFKRSRDDPIYFNSYIMRIYIYIVEFIV